MSTSRSSEQHLQRSPIGTQDGRVRAILGVPGGPLPPVEEKWLRRYYRYLAGTLSFPFPARYHEAVSPWEEITHTVTVLGLVDPAEIATDDGLLCRVLQEGILAELPLVDLEVEPHDRNFQFVEDYWYWAWNGRRKGRSAG
jgi:hypothetical protein